LCQRARGGYGCGVGGGGGGGWRRFARVFRRRATHAYPDRGSRRFVRRGLAKSRPQ